MVFFFFNIFDDDSNYFIICILNIASFVCNKRINRKSWGLCKKFS